MKPKKIALCDDQELFIESLSALFSNTEGQVEVIWSARNGEETLEKVAENRPDVLLLDYFFKGKEEFQKRMTNIDKMNYIFFNVAYIKNVTDVYDFSFESKPIWNYAAQAQIMLPWDIKSYMNYFILPAGGVWEIYKIKKDIQQSDISFSKDFWNKKLKVGVHAFDVFNQNEINALISSTNLQTNFYKKEDSRTFRISLTYNFGS